MLIAIDLSLFYENLQISFVKTMQLEIQWLFVLMHFSFVYIYIYIYIYMYIYIYIFPTSLLT